MPNPLIIPNTFTPLTVADAIAVNANFTAVVDAINAGIPASSLQFSADLSALTVYNLGSFVVTPPVNGGSALTNTAALTQMLAAMTVAPGLGGGYSWIPQYNFLVNSSEFGLTVPDNCILQALGTGGRNGGVEAYHFSITDAGGTGPFTFLNVAGPHNSGGTYLNSIAFNWKTPAWNLDTCLNLNLWNASVRDCTFTDCPTALNIQGLGSLVDHCTIYYGFQNGLPANVTAVILQAIGAQINGPCEINGSAGGGNLGGTSTAISIGGGVPNSNECTISRVHMVGWSYCIDYSDMNNTGIGSGCQDHVIRDSVLEASITSVYMVPDTNAAGIFNQKYIGCTITKGQNSTDGSPIVVIDSNGGPAANIGPISLTDCTIFSDVTGGNNQGGGGGHTGVAQNNQYGVKIGTAASVIITGGQISQMGGNNGTTGSANVCISGSPESVIIDGVNLSVTYGGANHGAATGTFGSGPSYYGLLITGSPVNVLVNDCDLTGVNVPISVTGSVTTMIVTNCPGYNDPPTLITTSMPTSGVVFSALTAGATPYYGPATFEVTGGTVADIIFFPRSGIGTPVYTSPLTSGTFSLSPGEACIINYTGSPSFVMVGR